jgi:hypothetical protein
MNNQELETFVVFPAICADLGGAEWARHSVGLVRIKLPGVPEPVRMKPAQIPVPPDKWTSFNLADAAAKASKR